MEHTDKKPETEARRMAAQVQEGFGLPEGTVHWTWPRKPMSGKDGKAPKTGKTQARAPSKARASRPNRKIPFPGW